MRHSISEKDELVDKLYEIDDNACTDGCAEMCMVKAKAIAAYIRKEYVRLKTEDIICPFCGEDNFDLPGLKYHFAMYCDKFAEAVDLPTSHRRKEERDNVR